MCNNFKENDVYNCYICISDCFRLFWLSKETLKKNGLFTYLSLLKRDIISLLRMEYIFTSDSSIKLNIFSNDFHCRKIIVII